jgi:acyl dehydratase
LKERAVAKDRFLEDVAEGEVSVDGPVEITEEEIVNFGKAYDPQPFHTDAAAAAEGPFGSLIASGWHLAALVMRQIVEAAPYGSTPILGMGLDELRWLHPVRPGDTLRIRREIVGVKRSASKPDRGVIKTRIEVTNQAGATVMTMTTLTQMPARPPALPA